MLNIKRETARLLGDAEEERTVRAIQQQRRRTMPPKKKHKDMER